MATTNNDYDPTKHNLNERLKLAHVQLEPLKAHGFVFSGDWRPTWSRHQNYKTTFYGESPLSWESVLRSINPLDPSWPKPIPALYLDPTPVDWSIQTAFKPTPVATAAILAEDPTKCLYPGSTLGEFFAFCEANSIEVFPYYKMLTCGSVPMELKGLPLGWRAAYEEWGRERAYKMEDDPWSDDPEPIILTFSQAFFHGERAPSDETKSPEETKCADGPCPWVASGGGWHKGNYPSNAENLSRNKVVWHHRVAGEETMTTIGHTGVADVEEHSRRLRSGELWGENVYMPVISFAIHQKGSIHHKGSTAVHHKGLTETLREAAWWPFTGEDMPYPR